MQVDISDQAQAVCVILKEFEQVEQQQALVGERMAELLYEQVRLAEKSRILKQTLSQFIKGHNHD